MSSSKAVHYWEPLFNVSANLSIAQASNLLSVERGRMKSMKIMLYLNQGKIENCNANGINGMDG